MTDKQHRRWFSFSLRTLLVLLTVLCIWFGWNVETVRRRKATRTALEALGVEIDDERGQYTVVGGTVTVSKDYPSADYIVKDDLHPRVSLIRRWLGDHAIWGISFPPASPRELLDRFDRDFPETSAAHRVY